MEGQTPGKGGEEEAGQGHIGLSGAHREGRWPVMTLGLTTGASMEGVLRRGVWVNGDLCRGSESWEVGGGAGLALLSCPRRVDGGLQVRVCTQAEGRGGG